VDDDAGQLWPPEMNSAVFVGGPADGAIRSVTLDADGRPPALLMWRADGVFVGTSDEAASAALVGYELVPGAAYPMAQLLYRHMGTLDG
jgi:hypothetical protein